YADRLRGQCEEHGMDHDIRLIEPWGTYRAHCAYKPTYILDRLVEHERTVLWIDVDSVISGPIRLEGSWDVGWCDNPVKRIRPRRANVRLNVTGGAMAFQNTPEAMKFLRMWKMRCDNRRPGSPEDHKSFDK